MKNWQLGILFPLMMATLAGCAVNSKQGNEPKPTVAPVVQQASPDQTNKDIKNNPVQPTPIPEVKINSESDVDKVLQDIDTDLQSINLENDFADLKNEDLGL